MPTSESLQLGLLPERRISWRTLATSYGLQVLLILLLLGLRLIWPERLELIRHEHVTALIPLPVAQPEPLKIQPSRPAPPPVPHIAPLTPPKLIVPNELAVHPKKPDIAPPKIEAEFKPPQWQPVAASLPARVVHTGAFGSSAVAIVVAPVQKVQTGDFGDPNGLPGQGKQGAHLTAAKLGSFDLLEGAGKGNGAGEAKGMQGMIASAGFGNGIAITNGSNNPAAVQNAGFGAQEVAHPAAKPMQPDGPATTAVEIISKPNPVYTEEARQLKIEGEVLLEVMFGANGRLHVNRVVRGLGHGLDETAIAAAGKIQFKPATRNGSPMDSTAIVHVVFQLAY